MNKLFRSRKAVSPVIATVLMILVTMAGMTILFGFVTSYTDSYKAGIGSSVMESLTVEDIWLSPGSSSYNNAVNVTIYNTGKVDSTITSAYANGLKLTDVGGHLNLKADIAVGQHTTLTLYWVSTWQSGQSYTFRMATQKGSNFDVTIKAP
jgi:archaeal type IV pilus assembly protein PilA